MLIAAEMSGRVCFGIELTRLTSMWLSNCGRISPARLRHWNVAGKASMLCDLNSGETLPVDVEIQA